MLDNKTVLITGGTGSFGKAFTKYVFERYKVKKLIVFSRDEFKQFEMAKIFPPDKFPIRYFLGDVRDKCRLSRAFEGVDYVIHAAALKQVPALEYNPMEAVKTNIIGGDNIVEAAIDSGVKKVIALSTDKAVNPINLYGATKLVAEKTFVAANAYAGGKAVFSVVRYGNVVGSRGSVIPLFLSLKAQGVMEFPVTDERMTRFWITLPQSVDLVIKALKLSVGAEVFVPVIPSMKVVDLARAIQPKCSLKIIGIRPGEKLHEALMSEHEGPYAKVVDGTYVILPQYYKEREIYKPYSGYPVVPEGFVYTSDTNDTWLTVNDLGAMLRKYEADTV